MENQHLTTKFLAEQLPEDKLLVIQILKTLYGLGLKGAKDLADSVYNGEEFKLNIKRKLEISKLKKLNPNLSRATCEIILDNRDSIKKIL